MQKTGIIKEQFHLLKQIVLTERNKFSLDEEQILRSTYRKFYKTKRIQKNSILYESYAGRGMICNPYAIFKAFSRLPIFNKYHHYWVLDDLEDNQSIIQEYQNFPNVHFIQYKSKEYLYHMATAAFLINNVAFPAFFTPKKKQIYINTWHGIPLKTLGFDIPSGNISSKNTLRNFLMCDYLISPNSFMTEIYKKAFKLENLYPGRIIQEGQPRNDNLFNTSSLDVVKNLNSHGIEIDLNKTIILFAPTWRGKAYETPDTSLEEYFKFINIMEQNLDQKKYQILIKPHQIVYKHIKGSKNLTNQFIPATVDTNELLSIVDILVSDYSSIFFDFLATEKPILFYIPDFEEYRRSRGIYHSLDTLPGPVAVNMEELPKWIKEIDSISMKYTEKYRQQKQWACPYDDGKVCARILDIIINQNENLRLISILNPHKKRLLLFGGFLEDNSITYSLENLLDYIDYNKFDITLLVLSDKDGSNHDAINSIPSNVRVMTFLGPPNTSLKENIYYKAFTEHKLNNKLKHFISLNKFFRQESLRVFGKSQFNFAVDYLGTNLHFNMLLLHSSADQKYVWQHNDLAEGENITDSSLKTIFSFYRLYNKIIFDSASSMRKALKYLSSKMASEKFSSCHNLINYKRIENSLNERNTLILDNKTYCVSNAHSEEIDSKLMLDLVPAPDADVISFVTKGKLIKQKNFPTLIQSFHKIAADYPKSRLYIIGEGPMKDYLKKLIKEINLDHQVYLLGSLKDPYTFMNKCDCFIFMSDTEGHPIDILEARVINLPIIACSIDKHDDICIKNGQIISDLKVEKLYGAMKKFLTEDMRPYNFDIIKYNISAYREFEKLFSDQDK